MLGLRALGIAFVVWFGCVGCVVQKPTPTIVPVSVVINEVKDELQFVADNLPKLEISADEGAICRVSVR